MPTEHELNQRLCKGDVYRMKAVHVSESWVATNLHEIFESVVFNACRGLGRPSVSGRSTRPGLEFGRPPRSEPAQSFAKVAGGRF